jgi:hypothetical protein
MGISPAFSDVEIFNLFFCAFVKKKINDEMWCLCCLSFFGSGRKYFATITAGEREVEWRKSKQKPQIDRKLSHH